MTDNIFESPEGFHPNQNLILTTTKADDLYDLDGLSTDDLLTLRAMIDDRLPVTNLKDIDLHRESIIQYMQARKLLNDVMVNDDIAPNQKAQVNNSVQANLAYLDKMQKEIYTSERSKQMEVLLVKYINEMPDDANRKAFLDEYAKRLGELS